MTGSPAWLLEYDEAAAAEALWAAEADWDEASHPRGHGGKFGSGGGGGATTKEKETRAAKKSAGKSGAAAPAAGKSGSPPPRAGLAGRVAAPREGDRSPAAQARREMLATPLGKEQEAAAVGLLDAGARGLASLPEDVRVGHAHAVVSVVSRMGAAAAKRAAGNVAFVRPVGSPKESSQAWTARTGEKLGRGETVLGFYDGESRSLTIDGHGEGLTSLRPHIWAHEIGHAVDGPRFELSGSKEWAHAYEAEVAGGALSGYAASNRQEGFAEFRRAVYAPGVLDKRAEEVEAQFPRCMAFFRERGLV